MVAKRCLLWVGGLVLALGSPQAAQGDGWAVGSGGVILRNTDDGSTWVAQTSGTTEYLSSVDFVDTLTGWAVGGSGTILHTTARTVAIASSEVPNTRANCRDQTVWKSRPAKPESRKQRRTRA